MMKTHLESSGLLFEGVSCLMLVCGVVMRLRSGVDSPVVNTGSAGSSCDSCNRGGQGGPWRGLTVAFGGACERRRTALL